MAGKVYRGAYRGKSAFDRARARIRDGLGLSHPPVMLAYRGFGTPERLVVRGRVVEDRAFDFDASSSALERLVAAWRRYATFEVAREPVQVRVGDETFEGASDREGYVDLELEPNDALSPGWHALDVQLSERRDAGSELDVLVIGEGARFGVISDIDDTVIETQATNPFKRAYALFWASAEQRLPFPGVAAFYDALADGGEAGVGNPLFYLSSSPWNLHDHLVELFEMHDMPKGPLLLRDWGFSEAGFAPTGSHRHKVEQVERVLSFFEGLPFVLIGDTGQEDAQRYATVVEQHPGRIRAVYLRHVRGARAGLEAAVERIRDAGVPVVVAKDTLDAARHAAELGLIDPARLPDVAGARDKDEETVLDKLRGDDGESASSSGTRCSHVKDTAPRPRHR